MKRSSIGWILPFYGSYRVFLIIEMKSAFNLIYAALLSSASILLDERIKEADPYIKCGSM